MIHVEDLDGTRGLVDAVSHAVGSAARAVAAGERSGKWPADAVPLHGECLRAELDHGRSQVWRAMQRQRGFRLLAEVVARHAGPEAVVLMGTYFRLGDPDAFSGLCEAAGLAVDDVRTIPITLRAPSIDAYVTTEVESTPLISRISDEVYGRIRADARVALGPFCDESGELAMPFEVLVVTACPR